MGAFSNFAISFSTICILAGGITSLQFGISAIGGAAAGIVWPVGVAFSLIVALCMAEVASAFPTAGGLYHWSSILGGKGWGWATAWFNLAGLVFVTAAVNVGAYELFKYFVGPMLGIDPASLGTGHQIAGVALISASHALLNHFGIRVTTRLTDLSGWLIFVVALVLTVAMLHGAPPLDLGRLFAFVDNGGAAGGEVWPAARGLGTMTLLALTWPIYTITGFDASAHTSEETVQAAHNVPKGILRSVYVSGLVGWVMVASFVLAMPDVAEGARQGADVFSWLMGRVLPGAGGRVLWVGIVVANYLCGLACMTSTSRMMYAFARDGGLPGSRVLKRVSPRWRTPVPAIWMTAVLALASTLYAPAYSTLTTACAIFLVRVVRDADAGRAARVWTDLDPFRSVSPRWPALQVARCRGGAGRGAARLDRRAASKREGADGRAGDGGPAARRVVAGHPPPLPRPARHEDRLTDPRNTPPEPRPGATRSRAAGSGARAGPEPPEPRAPTRARRSPAACA